MAFHKNPFALCVQQHLPAVMLHIFMCLFIACLLNKTLVYLLISPLYLDCPCAWKVVFTSICQKKAGRREGSQGKRALQCHLLDLHAFCPSLLPSPLPLAWLKASALTWHQDSLLVSIWPHPIPLPYNATEHVLKTQELLPVKPFWVSARKCLQNTSLIKDRCLEYITNSQNLIEENKQPFFLMCRRRDTEEVHEKMPHILSLEKCKSKPQGNTLIRMAKVGRKKT